MGGCKTEKLGEMTGAAVSLEGCGFERPFGSQDVTDVPIEKRNEGTGFVTHAA